jgi:endothelin-converting enzyme
LSIVITTRGADGDQIDDRNPKKNSLLVRPVYRHGLLSKSSYRDQTLVDRYSLVIKNVLTKVLDTATFKFSVLGDQEGRSLDELVQSLIAFEAQLFDAIPPLQEWLDVMKYYNIFSLEDANSLIPQISLRSLIANQTGNILPQMVVITSPSYIRALSEALHAADETTVQAYLVWRAVQVHAVNIEHESMRHFLEFQNSLQGKDPKASQERWKVCVRHVDKGLGKQVLRFKN